jgi:hypothetical protein
MCFNPLEQFEVNIYYNFSLFQFDFSISNAGFYMFLVVSIILLLFYFSLYFSYIIANS